MSATFWLIDKRTDVIWCAGVDKATGQRVMNRLRRDAALNVEQSICFGPNHPYQFINEDAIKAQEP